MKINFLKIKKRTKNFKKKGEAISPDSYWRAIITFAFILTILFFAFAFYNYLRINKDSTTIEEDGLSNPTVRASRINTALKYFEERADKSKSIISSPSPVIDPSI